MAVILNIETATKACSVALAKDGAVLAYKEVREEKFSHAEKLHVFIHEVMKAANVAYENLDAIAVGKGPGSYTGLRIGVSTAKGLAFAKDIPLISISTLQTLAKGQLEKYTDVDCICPMLDARRMEVYTAVFDNKLEVLIPVKAVVLDEKFQASLPLEKSILFCGDGSKKFEEFLEKKTAENFLFSNDSYPSAIDMITLSEKKFQGKDFEDTAYFEPFYLKDFIAGKPKKSV